MINILLNVKNKYNKMSSSIKASIWFTLCNILQKGIAMITVPIFTRIMNAEQYGIFSVYQSWYSIIVVFATLNLYYGVFNNGMMKYENNRSAFTSSLQGLTTVITAILFIIYLININLWNSIFGLPTILVVSMFFQLFFEPAFSFWAARQRYEFKYKALITVTIFITFSSPILGIITVLNSIYKAEMRVLSFVAIQVCIGLFFYILNFYKGKKFFNKEYWKFALRFNIPLIPHYLAQSVLQQSDRLMISNLIGNKEAAIYSVAYSVSTLMVLVISAINNSLIPYTYECLKNKIIYKLSKSVNALIILVGIGTFFVVAFGPEVISIFAPSEYYDAIWIIPPVSASVYFMFLYPLFGNIEFYYEENKFVMLASITGAIVNIVLNLLFIPVFGYIAAGYTTLFCYVLFSGGHYFFMKKVLSKHNVIVDIYDYKFIFVFSVFVVIAMGIMTLSYFNIFLRYILILFMLIMIFLHRVWILNVIKNTLK